MSHFFKILKLLEVLHSCNSTTCMLDDFMVLNSIKSVYPVVIFFTKARGTGVRCKEELSGNEICSKMT